MDADLAAAVVPLVVDLAMAVLAVEVCVGVGVRLRTRRGPAIGTFLPGLLAGLSILAAFRAALSGMHWTWIVLALSCALVAHVAEAWGRWREILSRRAPEPSRRAVPTSPPTSDRR